MEKLLKKIQNYRERIERFHNLNDYLKYFFYIRKFQNYLRSENLNKENYDTFSHIALNQWGNAGDIVLTKCVRSIFKDRFNKINLQTINVSNPVNSSIITKLNKSKAIIVGGGGLFFLPKKNKNSISGWCWPVGKQQLSEIVSPIIVYSVGYNFFRGQLPNSLFVDSINTLAEKSIFFSLRNSGSINAIQSLIEEKNKRKISYQPCPTTVIRNIFPELSKKEKTHEIAFNVAFDRLYDRLGNKSDLILDQIAKTAYVLEKKGYQISFISHCGVDERFIPYLKNNHVNANYYIISEWLPMDIINLYNHMDVVIGMRGHSQMIPFGLGCHIITLGSHDKMKWFLEDIEALDWYIELTSNPEKLSSLILEKFSEVFEENFTYTKKRLLEQQEKLWKITNDNLASIYSLINK